MTLAPEQAAGDALRRHFRRMLRRAERRFEAAMARDPLSAHRARRHLKSLRSFLVLMRPAIGNRTSRRARAVLRHAAHALAGPRQDEAMVEVAARMHDRSATDPAAAALWAAARAALGERRDRNVRHAGDIGDGDDIRKSLRRLRKAAKRWRLPNRRNGWVVQGMTRAYATARRHLRRGLAADDMASLHRARRFAIYQLHHMEWTAPVWPAIFTAWVAELEKLRAALGDLHDLDELAGLLDREPLLGLARSDVGRLQELIQARTAALTEEVEAAALRLFAERPAAYEARMRRLWKAFRTPAARGRVARGREK
ncbi:MAG TPA: CHAD domain-containing protein [Aestuariivirgaceae bacterium]|nr:CHAD domain-containing protein [Aestuariivirgaceae bacterium]